MSPTVDPRRTALVVIDVQKDYFPGGKFVLFRARAALRKTLRLRDWARAQGLAVWWIRHTSSASRSFFLVEGTPGADLHPLLQPREDEPLVNKRDPNCFLGTDLETQLRSRGIDTVVWAGMISWMCVETTVRSAKDKGFRNLVAHDAVASGWMKGPYGLVTPWSAHRAFLSGLGLYHAEVFSTAHLRSLEVRSR
jgi:nicotinamidase-related amidase